MGLGICDMRGVLGGALIEGRWGAWLFPGPGYLVSILWILWGLMTGDA